MKDIIEIYDDTGKSKKMEAVCIFKIKNYDYNYIIYSELDKSHYYLSKYSDDKTELINDFNDEEYNQALSVFMRLKNEIRN